MTHPKPVLRALTALLAASLACSLPGGPARDSTPSLPPVVATPTPTDEFPELPPPPPAGLVDALQAQVDAGVMTREEALVSGVQLLAGEVDPATVLDEAPTSLEGTGVVFDAQRYLLYGTNETTKAEIARLMPILAPLPEVLLPYSVREGASRRDGTRLARPAAQQNCGDLYASGFPRGSSGECFVVKETEFGSSTIQVFLPAAEQPDGYTPAFADAAQQAVLDSLGAFSALEIPGRPIVMKDVQVVFSLLDTARGTTLATVPTDPGQEPCQIVLFLLAMAISDPAEPSAFQQTVAHEVFHCFQVWNYPALAQNALWHVQDWWGESTATYFSNVVYPAVNDEWRWVEDWDYNSGATPLVYMSYDNFGFFQFLANRIGNAGILELIRSLEPAAEGDEAAQQAQLAKFPNIEELFEDYAVAFMDGKVADTSNELIPTTPAAVLPLFRVEVAQDGLVPSGGSPFTLTRYGLTLGSFRHYRFDPMQGKITGFAAIRPVNQVGQWADVPTQVDGDCTSRRYYLLMANAAPAADSSGFGLMVTGDEPLDCGFTPTPPPTEAAETPGPTQEACPDAFLRFGFLEAGTSRGYGCQDGLFRAWYDNDFASYEFISAAAGESYADVQIDVDVRLVQGVDFSGAFIVCRGSQDYGDFYYFKLYHTGGAIGEYNGGEEQIVRFADMPPGTDSRSWNRLRAECIGSHLALFINDALIVERDDDTVTRGDIGLGAGEGKSGFTEVLFDNLVVSTP